MPHINQINDKSRPEHILEHRATTNETVHANPFDKIVTLQKRFTFEWESNNEKSWAHSLLPTLRTECESRSLSTSKCKICNLHKKSMEIMQWTSFVTAWSAQDLLAGTTRRSRQRIVEKLSRRTRDNNGSQHPEESFLVNLQYLTSLDYLTYRLSDMSQVYDGQVASQVLNGQAKCMY